jgi:hypothetical protein
MWRILKRLGIAREDPATAAAAFTKKMARERTCLTGFSLLCTKLRWMRMKQASEALKRHSERKASSKKRTRRS